jgi:uncharacterized repeat protein (TIGR03803 family)
MTRSMFVAFVLLLAAAIASPAQELKTLVNFNGVDGYGSSAALVQGIDGNLYGITNGGGGSMFRLTLSGVFTTVSAVFGGPVGNLVRVADGNFYGVTQAGGTHSDGTVFRITLAGKVTTIYSFCARANCADGQFPNSLVLSPDGNFYGSTQNGGANGQGTIFKLTFDSVLTTLYSFCGQADCTDGEVPNGLILATDGNLYGTTQSGGVNGSYGTVFKIVPNGGLTTLYSFSAPDGYSPESTLLQGSDGNFYGTTHNGGANSNGTVFKITPAGTLTSLYNFCSQVACDDGQNPYAALIQANDGNFYGTAQNGGTNGGYGTIFKITPEGALTTLYSFNYTDGSNPLSALVQDTNGVLYGMTVEGGADGDGTIFFNLNAGLGKLVETLPTSGKVGDTIDILGQDLTGTTAVFFNGIAASFTVVSDTYLTATVPSGATTGFVTITTPSTPLNPSTTLKSNQKFRIMP